MGDQYEVDAVAVSEVPAAENNDPDLVYMPQTVPGVNVPHAWLAAASRQVSTIDITGHGGFQLLSGPGGEIWRTVCADFAAKTGILISVILIGPGLDYTDPYNQWRAVRAVADSGCVLVRPDRHIAWRAMTASSASVAALEHVMSKVLCA